MLSPQSPNCGYHDIVSINRAGRLLTVAGLLEIVDHSDDSARLRLLGYRRYAAPSATSVSLGKDDFSHRFVFHVHRDKAIE